MDWEAPEVTGWFCFGREAGQNREKLRFYAGWEPVQDQYRALSCRTVWRMANRERRMTYCLLGAGVQDVVERYGRVVEGTGKEALMVVYVGVNNVGRVRSEELMDRYRKLLREVNESGRRCIVSRVLPRQGVRGW